MTSNLALAGVIIALAVYVIRLLVRASRAQGRADAQAEVATSNREILSDVQEIQARPIPSRSELIDRMRARSGGNGSSLPPA